MPEATTKPTMRPLDLGKLADDLQWAVGQIMELRTRMSGVQGDARGTAAEVAKSAVAEVRGMAAGQIDRLDRKVGEALAQVDARCREIGDRVRHDLAGQLNAGEEATAQANNALGTALAAQLAAREAECNAAAAINLTKAFSQKLDLMDNQVKVMAAQVENAKRAVAEGVEGAHKKIAVLVTQVEALLKARKG